MGGGVSKIYVLPKAAEGEVRFSPSTVQRVITPSFYSNFSDPCTNDSEQNMTGNSQFLARKKNTPPGILPNKTIRQANVVNQSLPAER